MAAKAEANRLMAAEHPSEKAVVRKLAPIQKKYQLTSAQVVQEARDERTVKYHVKLAINPETDTDSLVDPSRLNLITVSPKFKFRSSPGRNTKSEFDRQLSLQEATMNGMDVQKWLRNRARWSAPGGGRSTEGTKEQADVLENERLAFRKRALDERTAAYLARGLSATDAADRAQLFVNRLLERVRLPTNRSKYKNQQLPDDFGTVVQNEMWRKVALHALDQVAGGEGTDLRGVGGESEDKSIGRQWVSEPRIDNIEKEVKAQVKAFKLTDENLSSVSMNVKLLPFDEV
jgi:hypothetical protein